MTDTVDAKPDLRSSAGSKPVAWRGRDNDWPENVWAVHNDERWQATWDIVEPLGVITPAPDLALQDAIDADRYRWLRSRDIDAIHQGGIFAGQTPENLVLNGEDLDHAIDAARSRDGILITCLEADRN